MANNEINRYAVLISPTVSPPFVSATWPTLKTAQNSAYEAAEMHADNSSAHKEDILNTDGTDLALLGVEFDDRSERWHAEIFEVTPHGDAK